MMNFEKIDIGTISGKISDSQTGSALTEAELQAFKVDANGNAINNWPDFHIWLDSGKMLNGTFNVQFPTGKYIFRVK